MRTGLKSLTFLVLSSSNIWAACLVLVGRPCNECVFVVVPDPSPGISPVFAFPSGLLQYVAVYMSVSHVCCACRSLERTASQGHQHDKVQQQSQGTWGDLVWVWQLKRCLKYVYSPCLVALVIALLFSPDFYPGHTGDFACFPCRCDMGHLQSCGLAGKLQQQQLAITNLTGIDQNVFKPLGCQVSQLSLANSSLFQLTSKSFKDLPCLRVLDLGRAKLRSLHEDSFFGLEKLEVLSLSQNELTQISVAHLSHLPSLEQLLSAVSRTTESVFLHFKKAIQSNGCQEDFSREIHTWNCWTSAAMKSTDWIKTPSWKQPTWKFWTSAQTRSFHFLKESLPDFQSCKVCTSTTTRSLHFPQEFLQNFQSCKSWRMSTVPYKVTPQRGTSKGSLGFWRSHNRRRRVYLQGTWSVHPDFLRASNPFETSRLFEIIGGGRKIRSYYAPKAMVLNRHNT